MKTTDFTRPARAGGPFLFRAAVMAALMSALVTVGHAALKEKSDAPMESAAPAPESSAQQEPDAAGVTPAPSADRPITSPGPQPQRIIVVPDYPIDLRIWTDHTDYYPGDRIRVYFQSNRNAWVYIFNVDTRGRTYQIFPNYFDQDNFVQGRWRYSIPDRHYELIVTGPPGVEHLKIVAVPERCSRWEHHFAPNSERPYPEVPGGVERFLNDLERQSGESAPYRSPSDQSVQYKRLPPPASSAETGVMRVEPVPPPVSRPPHYAIAWTSFTVRSWRPDPPYPRPHERERGRLELNSEPPRAEVYINDEFFGRTPLDVELEEGHYDVRIQKWGWRPWVKTVRVKADRTTRYSVRLRPR
ncbi:MAG: hypothetical protein Kow0059_08230 [Candidatus Sumerlaeia bacterium]